MNQELDLDLSPATRARLESDPVGFFRRRIPGFMQDNGGYLRTMTAFKILTGQPYGPSASNKYVSKWNLGFVSGSHMMHALRDLKRLGVVRRRSRSVYVLTEKGWDWKQEGAGKP